MQGRFIPFVLCFLALATPAFAASDGFYETAKAGDAVQAVNGKDIHLGGKIDETVTTAIISSVSNDNARFNISLEKKGAFSRDYGAMALCADGHCVQFNSGGNSNNETFTMGAQFDGREAAEAFAKHFNVAPQLRVHPGHLLSARFLPSKQEYSVDEPMPVTLEIKNAGTVPFTFQDGGQNRGERNNQFGFTAYDGVTAVPDTGSPVHFGGISVNKTLQPGEVFTKEIDLRKWFTFKKPGVYFITGTYDLNFFAPEAKYWFVLWEDFAAARFYVRIKE